MANVPDPSINPRSPSVPPSIQGSAAQGPQKANADSSPPAANSPLVYAGMDLIVAFGDMFTANTGVPLNPLEANVLGQAVINFNNAYTAQYGSAPTSGSSTNWAQQMEYDITQPPGNSLLSLAQAGNTNGIIAYCSTNYNSMRSAQINLMQQMREQSGPLPGAVPAPEALLVQASQLFTTMSTEPPLSDQMIQLGATAINTLVSGLDAMAASGPLDPTEQVLLWTLTLPCNSDPNSSLSDAAQAYENGDQAPLTNLLNSIAGQGTGSEAGWVEFMARGFYFEQQ